MMSGAKIAGETVIGQAMNIMMIISIPMVLTNTLHASPGSYVRFTCDTKYHQRMKFSLIGSVRQAAPYS